MKLNHGNYSCMVKATQEGFNLVIIDGYETDEVRAEFAGEKPVIVDTAIYEAKIFYKNGIARVSELKMMCQNIDEFNLLYRTSFDARSKYNYGRGGINHAERTHVNLVPLRGYDNNITCMAKFRNGNNRYQHLTVVPAEIITNFMRIEEVTDINQLSNYWFDCKCSKGSSPNSLVTIKEFIDIYIDTHGINL